MRAGTLAVLALACAALAYIGPTSAYQHGAFSRDASAEIVSQSSAYHAVSVQSPCDQGAATSTCTITITNKGTASVTYTVSEDPDNAFVERYKIDGSGWVSAGSVTSPSATSVGADSTITIEISACTVDCLPQDAYYTVEGEKAGSLTSMQTKIKIQMN